MYFLFFCFRLQFKNFDENLATPNVKQNEAFFGNVCVSDNARDYFYTQATVPPIVLSVVLQVYLARDFKV